MALLFIKLKPGIAKSIEAKTIVYIYNKNIPNNVTTVTNKLLLCKDFSIEAFLLSVAALVFLVLCSFQTNIVSPVH